MDDREAQGAAAPPIWRTALDFSAQDAGHYLDNVNPGLLRLVDGSPRRVLELGCAGGMFGATLKATYPGVTVVGIEAGSAAAEKAATRLDRVIHGRIEEIDFAAEGFVTGEFDTVVAGDILEHLFNPWELLVRVKPYLAPNAQLLASIPNVRNIWLVSQLLLLGRWEYVGRGLLDITHLRFFTLHEIRKMFEETGFRIESTGCGILPHLQPVFEAYKGQGTKQLKVDRMTIADVSPEEMTEFCAAQYFLRCRPA